MITSTDFHKFKGYFGNINLCTSMFFEFLSAYIFGNIQQDKKRRFKKAINRGFMIIKINGSNLVNVNSFL